MILLLLSWLFIICGIIFVILAKRNYKELPVSEWKMHRDNDKIMKAVEKLPVCPSSVYVDRGRFVGDVNMVYTFSCVETYIVGLFVILSIIYSIAYIFINALSSIDKNSLVTKIKYIMLLCTFIFMIHSGLVAFYPISNDGKKIIHANMFTSIEKVDGVLKIVPIIVSLSNAVYILGGCILFIGIIFFSKE